MGYCTVEQLKQRLTLAGVTWVLDDDGDESVDSTEMAELANIIAERSAEIDMALSRWVVVPISEAQDGENEWLTGCCLALSVEQAFERGNRQPGDAIVAAAARYRGYLKKIAAGEMRPPGITYATDDVTPPNYSGLPRIAIPKPRKEIRWPHRR